MSQNNRRVLITNGLLNVESDYGEKENTNPTTETYTFREGGEAGTIVRQVVLIYFDSSKEDLWKWYRSV